MEVIQDIAQVAVLTLIAAGVLSRACRDREHRTRWTGFGVIALRLLVARVIVIFVERPGSPVRIWTVPHHPTHGLRLSTSQRRARVRSSQMTATAPTRTRRGCTSPHKLPRRSARSAFATSAVRGADTG